jgi:hypothetical protein
MISDEEIDANNNKTKTSSMKMANATTSSELTSKLTHVNLNKGINTLFKELNVIRHAIEDNIDDSSDVDYHNEENKTESQSVVIERQGGLANRFVLFLLFAWYLFSAFTLYTNKYLVGTRKADSFVVG